MRLVDFDALSSVQFPLSRFFPWVSAPFLLLRFSCSLALHSFRAWIVVCVMCPRQSVFRSSVSTCIASTYSNPHGAPAQLVLLRSRRSCAVGAPAQSALLRSVTPRHFHAALILQHRHLRRFYIALILSQRHFHGGSYTALILPQRLFCDASTRR